MDSRKVIGLILVILSMVFIISSDVSARVFSETSSNVMKDIGKRNNINKVSYGNGAYRGFGGGSYNGGYQNNGGGYFDNNGGYFGGYPNIDGGYPNIGGAYPGYGGGYRGNGGYGGGYPGNVGGNNGNDFLGNIGGIIGDILGNIGSVIGGRRGATAAVQTKDNTRN